MRAWRYILWFVVDVSIKGGAGFLLVMGVGFALATLGLFGMSAQAGEFPSRPWVIAGLIAGVLVNGFFELSDVFSLKKLFGID